MNDIHVVLVANTLWSVYNFRKGLICSLIKCGHKVTIVGPNDDYAVNLRGLGCNVEFVDISSQGKNPFTDLMLIVKLKRIYDKLNPDFIFHYTIKPNIYGSIAAALSRKNSIAITTGLGFVFNKSSLFTSIIAHLYSFSLRYAKEVWFLNDDDRAVFVKKNIVDKNKTYVLDGEGVDTEFFAPIYCSDSSRTRQITFLLVARMLWDKGIGIYVDAARQLKLEYPDVSFQLLGACDIENPSAISRKIICDWHDEGVIDYLGVTNDVRAKIAQVDCVVLPSYYREGIPRTLMEAASMGKPIITTDNVGCRNVIIDEETGFLCKIKDVASLMGAMRRIIDSTSDERVVMGQRGREYICSRFDEKVIIEIYHQAIEKHLMVNDSAIN
ncbi:glycosyltransferase family 4 protein [Hafnia alvei]|uniref:glycosyltransferase family 4 protein n=1 Tax=Hafnia alvei TaxID=569 RepID=UPI002161F1D2|nr:glycosyltransferase family 4 protein [Hafnia alvei]